MKARRKDGPVYKRAVVEEAEELLPDPEDLTQEIVEKCGISLKDDYLVCTRNGIDFRRIPTIDRHPFDGATHWRWELVGSVEQEDKH